MSSEDKIAKKTKDAVRNVLKNGKTRVYSDDGHSGAPLLWLFWIFGC